MIISKILHFQSIIQIVRNLIETLPYLYLSLNFSIFIIIHLYHYQSHFSNSKNSTNSPFFYYFLSMCYSSTAEFGFTVTLLSPLSSCPPSPNCLSSIWILYSAGETGAASPCATSRICPQSVHAVPELLTIPPLAIPAKTVIWAAGTLEASEKQSPRLPQSLGSSAGSASMMSLIQLIHSILLALCNNCTRSALLPLDYLFQNQIFVTHFLVPTVQWWKV